MAVPPSWQEAWQQVGVTSRTAAENLHLKQGSEIAGAKWHTSFESSEPALRDILPNPSQTAINWGPRFTCFRLTALNISFKPLQSWVCLHSSIARPLLPLFPVSCPFSPEPALPCFLIALTTSGFCTPSAQSNTAIPEPLGSRRSMYVLQGAAASAVSHSLCSILDQVKALSIKMN